MTTTVISDADYRLPCWADEVRRPAPDVVEYWKPIDLLVASDRGERVSIELVQRGPEAPMQLLIGETRFTLSEATDLLHDVLWNADHAAGRAGALHRLGRDIAGKPSRTD